MRRAPISSSRLPSFPSTTSPRTERSIFLACADEIVAHASRPSGADPAPILTLIELGAGTATKTGILLSAAVPPAGKRRLSASRRLPDRPRRSHRQHPSATSPASPFAVRSPTTPASRFPSTRLRNTRTLALYIGSSIGNFSPVEATAVLSNLRAQLLPGDMLLLGTRSGTQPPQIRSRPPGRLHDAIGITAAFDLNVLHPPQPRPRSRLRPLALPPSRLLEPQPLTHRDAPRIPHQPDRTHPRQLRRPRPHPALQPRRNNTHRKQLQIHPPHHRHPPGPPPLSHPPKPGTTPDGLFAVTPRHPPSNEPDVCPQRTMEASS